MRHIVPRPAHVRGAVGCARLYGYTFPVGGWKEEDIYNLRSRRFCCDAAVYSPLEELNSGVTIGVYHTLHLSPSSTCMRAGVAGGYTPPSGVCISSVLVRVRRIPHQPELKDILLRRCSIFCVAEGAEQHCDRGVHHSCCWWREAVEQRRDGGFIILCCWCWCYCAVRRGGEAQAAEVVATTMSSNVGYVGS